MEDDKGWDTEAYESSDLLYKFQKRVERWPSQCVRYCFGGKPLLMSAELPTDIPPCDCGAQRVFELQLLPTLSTCMSRSGCVPNLRQIYECHMRRHLQSTLGTCSSGPAVRAVVPTNTVRNLLLCNHHCDLRKHYEAGSPA